MKTVAIIQARYSSSRLPGKVLLSIGEKPMLAWVVERTRRAQLVDEVVVATTTDETDDAVAEMCNQHGYPCFRGSLFDVLDRYYQTALFFKADTVVRITADCPLIDPFEIDHTLEVFLQCKADFAANRLPPPFRRTYPIGLDTEVCSFAALAYAWQKADKPYQREHVMPFIYEDAVANQQNNLCEPCMVFDKAQFKVVLVNHEPDYGAMRWTVDTQQDLDLVRAIVKRFNGRDDFSWTEVLDLLNREPHLMKINADVQHKTMVDTDTRNQA
ncbi:MAG: glycosyltransferase family protein [Chloroflexota bacterium]